MEDNTTVEVNPSELSEETVNELVEEGSIDESDAEKFEEQIWFDEIDKPNPSSERTLKEHIWMIMSSTFDTFVTFASKRADAVANKKTAFVKIESVERTENDEIKLHLSHPRDGDGSIRVSPDSDTLGNIMELAQVENPKNLEGGRLVSKRDDGRCSTVEIPRNLSTFGRTRYKSYGAIKELRERTKVESINADSAYLVAMGFIASFIPLMIGVMIRDASTLVSNIFVTPFLIITLLVSVFTLYGMKRIAMAILGALVKGDMKEKIAR